MTSIRDLYLLAAESAVTLLADPAVTARWDEPSALAEFSVRGLAGHLSLQSLRVEQLLDAEVPPAETASVERHYSAARWIAAIDTPDNVRVRDGGEQLAADGQDALVQRATATLDRLRELLPAQPADRLVFVPWTGWQMALDDFLFTRLLELTIHSDDLAVSVDVPTPDLPLEVYEPVLAQLTRMSVELYGPVAVLRALARRERAPETIAAI
jgi:hypothetical protein